MSLSTPSKVSVAFASNGTKNSIPATTSVGDPTNKASYSVGFPTVTMTPKSAGGLPPFGRDMNGILYDITAEIQYRQAGGRYPFDSSFSTAIGGYGKGAVVQRADLLGSWVSQANNNTTSPETSSTLWQPEGASSYSFTVSNADVTLTNAQAAHPVLIVSGTLTANVSVILPAFLKTWAVVDMTNHGQYSISFKTANGTGVSLSIATEQLVCDGTNILRVGADPSMLIPTGMVVPFFGTTIPAGYLVANGSAVSRTLYANLFAVIGTMYGSGDGSTTFNLPDLTNRFVRYGTIAQVGTKVAESLKSHTHGVTQSAHTHGVTDNGHVHTASTSSAGSHVHDRGNMEISGDVGEILHSEIYSGAIYSKLAIGNRTYPDGPYPSANAGFQASRSWSGYTSTPLNPSTHVSAPNHTHPVTVNSAKTGIAMNGATANITVNASGGTETAPMHIYAIPLIKA